MILEIGPRLEGHLPIFSGIQTHPSCRFHLAVALGAYAAHGLGGRAEAELLGWVEVGADYGLVHALALLGVGLLAGRTARPRLIPPAVIIDLCGPNLSFRWT